MLSPREKKGTDSEVILLKPGTFTKYFFGKKSHINFVLKEYYYKRVTKIKINVSQELSYC